MATLSTATAVNGLVQLIKDAEFTNVDVVSGVIPNSSRALEDMVQSFTRGNSTIIVMPTGHKPRPLQTTTQGRVTRYETNETYRIGVYSRFFLSDKNEDLLTVFDNLMELLHNNRYVWLADSISDSSYSVHSNNYYEVKIDVLRATNYPNN